MTKFFNRNRMLIVLFGIVVLIALIGFSLSDRDSTTKAEQFTGDTAAATQKVVDAPFSFIGNIFSNIAGSFSALEENEELKQQLDMLPQLQADNERLKAENEELRESLEVSSSMAYETVNARVISRAPDQWLESFTIDKGEKDGIKEGMAVSTSEGLVGIVKRVNGKSSFIEMISTNASQNNLSVEVRHNDEAVYGNIRNFDTENDVLVVENIKSQVKLEKGDEVFTSGLTGAFPEGIVIGKVVEVENDEYGLSQNAYVQMNSDLNDVDNVFVLKRDPESLED
ncbi:rod shape-determining protein MreC [Jeotgalicoccus nanhaiensis]|uniref:Cell shape-determining protein MreC n=1 Tax=Jeotgalicoccus nanhaiensis TaxID=568603 RepID=A0ABR9XWS8_9STAP|nr:rod shape-determining protein MreC [Jeotgalicoccus nanhaiensis]TFU62365.1 rod shape-determining protein MreC [Jeotgalicoccus nanhaiensis]